MIARVWCGIAHPTRADEYHQHLLQATFPQLRSLAGFKSGFIMRRDVDDGIEFLVITHWSSLDSIRDFAGDDLEVAVVPAEVQAMMLRYDKDVRHYDVLPVAAT